MEIYKVLEGIYKNIDLRRSIVPLFIGDPGVSKSVQVRQFAKDKGVKLIPFITSQRNPFEISGLAMPNRKTERMEFWDFDTLLEMKDGDILFFDEIFNGNPTVLNACLTILEEREMISGKKLPDIMIVAAANPQGMIPLTPQIKERFVWYEFKFLKDDWQKFMRDKYKMPVNVSSKLCRLINEEKFKKAHNYHSARSIDKAVNMIINNVESPYEDDLLPILETLIPNKTGNQVKLSEDVVIEPEESISWLNMIKLNKNIELPEKPSTNTSNDDFEILIIDEKDVVLGKFKSIKDIAQIHYLPESSISNINKGEKVLITPPPESWRSRPHPLKFFKKINN